MQTMTKDEAIEILGGQGKGRLVRAAAMLRRRHSALSQWPDGPLSLERHALVIGYAQVHGKTVPDRFLKNATADA